MEEVLIQNAAAYASREHLQLAERLGFGIHGIIFVAEDKRAGGKSAIKAHREADPYHRELSVYGRLQQYRITEILGFNVPQFIGADDDLRVIEMTIVTRPFALDFAGAFLDTPPSFTEEAWTHWESERRDQFEEKWPRVQSVIVALHELDIYMIDVSPSNIAFLA